LVGRGRCSVLYEVLNSVQNEWGKRERRLKTRLTRTVTVFGSPGGAETWPCKRKRVLWALCGTWRGRQMIRYTLYRYALYMSWTPARAHHWVGEGHHRCDETQVEPRHAEGASRGSGQSQSRRCPKNRCRGRPWRCPMTRRRQIVVKVLYVLFLLPRGSGGG
jgi:hypothetical protein